MAENTGITAIFGANSEEGVSLVRSVADTFKIPYFFAIDEMQMYEDSTAINVYPKIAALTQVWYIGDKEILCTTSLSIIFVHNMKV